MRYLSDQQVEDQVIAARVEIDHLRKRVEALEHPVRGCQNHGSQPPPDCGPCRAISRVDEIHAAPQSAQEYMLATHIAECTKRVGTTCLVLGCPRFNLPEANSTPRVETGWLIEVTIGGRAVWWAGRDLGYGRHYTTDASAAVRFARQSDAERVIARFPAEFGAARATEHSWSCP